MANNAQINIGVAYNIDQRSFNNVMKAFDELDTKAKSMLNNKEADPVMKKQLQEVNAEATKLKNILESSWDNKLGQLNLTQFNSQLATAKTTATQFYDKLAAGGAEGKRAADAFARSILETNIELEQSNKLLDKMAVTFGNTIRYGISSSIFNTVTNAIRNAYEYSKQLDTSLNDIRIVSGKSALEMEKFAASANKAAQSLGKSTLDYTKAATIFYQQGLATDEVEKRTEIVLKAANVTGQSASEVSEQLTSVWNGYQVGIGELELYVDKLSAVAASSASNLEELSSGMSKVASAANVMGVDIDQLTAQMSTIISVTRQAPESVGTALRTIYARIADIKAGLDDEVTLGNYSGKMKKLGFDVLDASGNLKDMGDVIEEIGSKWSTLSKEQQVSLAQVMAGTRQYNNLLTLFDNWDKYTGALKTSQEAAGKLQEQQDIYMESTEAHLQQLQTTAEELYATLFDQDLVKGFVDTLNVGLKSITQYVKSLGGGLNSFLGLGSHLVGIFNNKIGDQFSARRERAEARQKNENLMKNHAEMAQEVMREHATRGEDLSQNAAEIEAKWTAKILDVKEHLTKEEFKQLNIHKQRLGIIQDEKKALEEEEGKIQLALEQQQYKITYKNGQKVQTTSQEWNKAQTIFNKYGADFKASNPNNTALNVNDAESLTSFIDYLHKNSKAINEEDKVLEKEINEFLKQRVEYLQQANTNREKQNQIGKEEKAREEDINEGVKKGKNRGDTKGAVKAIAAGLQATTAMVGMVKVLSSESATAEDRASAMFNGILGGAASAISAINPVAGMIAQMGIGLLDTLGVSKLFAAALETESEKAARIAKEMNEAYKEQAQRVSEVENNVKNLQSSFDQYEKAIDTIDDLVKGTDEWEEAVYNVNQQVLDLMEKFPQLAQYVEEVNGILTIDRDGYQEVLKQQKIMLAQDRQAAAAVKMDANKASQDSLYTDYGDTLKKSYAFSNGPSSYVSSQSLGEAVLSVYRNNTDLLTKSTSDIAAALRENLGSVFSDKELNAIANEIKNNSSNLRNLDSSVKSLDDSTKILAKQFASGYVESFGNETLSGSAYRSIIDAAVADIYDTPEYKKWFEENYAENSGSAKVDSTVGEEYAKYVRSGWTYKKQDDEGYIYFADENGKEVKMADETVRAELGRKIYADRYFNEEALVKKNDDLVKLQDELMNLLDADQTTVEQLINSMASGKSIDFSLLDEEQIKKFGNFINTSNWGNRADLFNYKPDIDNPFGLPSDIWKKQLANSDTDKNLIKNALDKSEKYIKGANKTQGALNELSAGTSFEDLSEEQKNHIKSLEEEYKVLGDIQNKNSAEYLHTLREIEEEEERIAAEELEKARKRQVNVVADLYTKLEELKANGASEVEITAATDKFEEAMQKLEDIDHSIKVQIDADLKSDVDDAFGLAKQFDQLRTKVGQSLELTYDEAQELIKNGYGEILQNAKETANATIKLDKATVDSFIDGRQSQLKADKESKIKELENRRAILVAQQKALESEIKAYESAYNAKDEVSAAQALNEANRYDEEYQNQVKTLNEELNKEGEAAEAKENIDKDLYKNLGTMRTRNITNAEEAATTSVQIENDNDKKKFDIIENIYKAWKTVGIAMEQAASGKVTIGWPTFKGGVGVTGAAAGFSVKNAMQQVANQMTAAMSNYTPKELTAEDLKDSFKDKASHEQYQNTIQKIINERNQELQSIKNQIGAIDSGIAALKAADASLDKYQSGLGKGSGSSSKDKELGEAELDRYMLVNVQLQEISKNLERLQKQKKKLLGGDLVKNLNNQIKQINNELSVTNRKLQIQEKERDELAGKLSGFGVKFDNDGNIANYEQIWNKLRKQQEQTYASTTDEDKRKAVDQQFNNFVKYLERYNTLVGEEIPSSEQALIDKTDQKIELLMEEFNLELDVRLNLAEAERDWNQFKRRVIEGLDADDPLGLIRTIKENLNTYVNGEGTGEIETTIRNMQGVMENLAQMNDKEFSDWYGNDKASAISKLGEDLESLEKSIPTLLDSEINARKQLISTMSKVQSEFDKQMKQYEGVNKLIEHNVSLLKFYTGKDNHKGLAEEYALRTKNTQAQLAFYTKEKEYWAARKAELQKGSDEWVEACEKENAAIEKTAATLVEANKNALEQLKEEMAAIFQDINNELTGGIGLDYAETEWKLLKENSELALDNYNRIAKIQGIAKKYNDAINSTSNITNQKKLAQLRDHELEALKQMSYLSEKDVQRAEKKFEIAKAQYALEDAQRNKTQMRLRRDSQGNYRYQFVADEEEVQKAQENLNNAYNALYNFDVATEKSIVESKSKLTSQWEKDRNAAIDSIADKDLLQKTLEMIDKEYYQKLNMLNEQSKRAQQNLEDSAFAYTCYLYDQDVDNYELMTEAEKALLDNVLENKKEAEKAAFDLTFGMITNTTQKIKDLTDETKRLILKELVPQTASVYNSMSQNMEDTAEQVYNTMTEKTEEILNNYWELVDENKELFKGVAESYEEAMAQAMENTSQLVTDSNELMANQTQVIQDVIKEYDQIIRKLQPIKDYIETNKDLFEKAHKLYTDTLGDAADKYKENVESGPTTGGTGEYLEPTPQPETPTTNTNTTTNNTPTYFKGITGVTSHNQLVDIIYGIWQGCYGNGQARIDKINSMYPGQYATLQGLVNKTGAYANNKSKMGSYLSSIGYDTGGYTGDWGNSGRLAILHQKEIVLNKDDTANMLNAVEIMRNITDNIGADILGKIAGVGAIGMNGTIGSSLLDQNVHIEATFPGVTSSIEIQDALNNLVNMAAQRAQIK